MDVAANSRTCPECDFEFPVKHDATADATSQLTGKQEPEEWLVTDVFFKRHDKKATAENTDPQPTVRVDYVCRKVDKSDGDELQTTGTGGNLSSQTISEWICPEHSGFAFSKLMGWWDARSTMSAPDTVEDTLDMLTAGACRHPVKITTVKAGKYTQIKSCDFGEAQKPTEMKEDDEPVSEFSGLDDDVPF